MGASQEPDPVHMWGALAIPDVLAPGRPELLTVPGGGGLAAAAALRVHRRRGLVRISHHVATPNRYTTGLMWRDEAACAALADRLLDLPGDVIDLVEIPVTDPLVEHLMRRGAQVRLSPGPNRYVARLDAGRMLPPRIAREVRRAHRLAGPGADGLTHEVLTQADRVEGSWPTIAGLLAGAQIQGVLDPYVATDAGREHLRRLVVHLVAAGRGRVIVVSARRTPVAVAIVATEQRSAIGLRLSFDRSIADTPSLGWVVLATLMEHLRTDGITRLDVGTGGDRTKSRYARAQATRHVRVILSRRARLRFATRDLARRLLTRPADTP